MDKHDGRSFRVTPFVQMKLRAVRLEGPGSFWGDRVRMVRFVHGTRQHTRTGSDVTPRLRAEQML
jgi:hypothetical protein